MAQFLAIIYIISKFNFFIYKKETLLAQFWIIIYITSEFNSYKKTNTLLVQFCVIIYITSEINFMKKKTKKKHFIGLVLGINLHN